MILQALYEYAQRMDDNLPEDGFEKKEFKFLIKIKADGTFVDLLDMREKKDDIFAGKEYIVPKYIERSGPKSYEITNLLWDNYCYVLNEPKRTSKVSEKIKKINDAKKQNETFISMVNSLPKDVLNDKGVAAVANFYAKYKKGNYSPIRKNSNWDEAAKNPGSNVTFILTGDKSPIICREAVKNYQRQIIKQSTDEDDKSTEEIIKGICLITGENAIISRTHAITTIPEANSKAKLVSFQEKSGYDSYGRKKAYNAPVSVKAVISYTKALNYLIKSSKNHFRLGKDTVVYWAEKKEADLFVSTFSVFFSNDYNNDNANMFVSEVKNLFDSIKTGKKEIIDSNFYVLCLSPNEARISVRFWETGKVKTFAERIEQHFKDFDIVHSNNSSEYLNIFQILSATALGHQMKNVPPNLMGTVVQAILKGLPYPITLQQQCIRRIRAEKDFKDEKNRRHYKVNRERAAILKAYINRINRKNNKKEVSVALDRNCTDKGYLLGRLFAVYEKVQQDIHPGINATITDRFYDSASTNPVTAFAQLTKLNRHHLSSYANMGFKIAREKEIGEIMNLIDSFPAHLDLNEQSYFAIGYYHEKQDLWSKSEKKEGEK